MWILWGEEYRVAGLAGADLLWENNIVGWLVLNWCEENIVGWLVNVRKTLLTDSWWLVLIWCERKYYWPVFDKLQQDEFRTEGANELQVPDAEMRARGCAISVRDGSGPTDDPQHTWAISLNRTAVADWTAEIDPDVTLTMEARALNPSTSRINTPTTQAAQPHSPPPPSSISSTLCILFCFLVRRRRMFVSSLSLAHPSTCAFVFVQLAVFFIIQSRRSFSPCEFLRVFASI